MPPRNWITELADALAAPPPRRLAPPAAGNPATTRPRADQEPRQAAVLVPLWVDAGELWTLLVRRAANLRNHRGQYAFAGGGREAGEDPWATALREADEELGIDSAKVLPIGQLDEQETPSGFRVVPCVGALPVPDPAEPLVRRVDPNEIDDVFVMPVRAFTDPQLVEDREVLIDGNKREIRIYHLGRRQIWGMTARVLQNLLDRIAGPNAVT